MDDKGKNDMKRLQKRKTLEVEKTQGFILSYRKSAIKAVMASPNRDEIVGLPGLVECMQFLTQMEINLRSATF